MILNISPPPSDRDKIKSIIRITLTQESVFDLVSTMLSDTSNWFIDAELFQIAATIRNNGFASTDERLRELKQVYYLFECKSQVLRQPKSKT